MRERGRGQSLLLLLLSGIAFSILLFLLNLSWERRELERRLEQERKRSEALELVAARLTERRVLADVVVLAQHRDERGGVQTTFRIHPKGRAPEETPLEVKGPYVVDGDTVYFEALVIRFDDEYVKLGDPLRGKAIYVLTRVFGEEQAPSEGFPIEELDLEIPFYYRIENEELRRFEEALWRKFWYYATHRAEAREVGIDVAVGKDTFTRLVPEAIYELVMDNRGNFEIRQKL